MANKKYKIECKRELPRKCFNTTASCVGSYTYELLSDKTTKCNYLILSCDRCEKLTSLLVNEEQ